MEWYYILGIISYGIFIVQFILSNFGFIDLDVDLDSEFSLGDLISFKGLTHFCMGFSGWLMIRPPTDTFVIISAITVGFIFVLVLAFIYTLCTALRYEPHSKEGIDLIGTSVAISAHLGGKRYLAYLNNPIYTELQCISDTDLKVGDIRTIQSYKNGLYYLI